MAGQLEAAMRPWNIGAWFTRVTRNNLDQLISFVSGKSIALVGNAQSLLCTHNNIDDHDIVVRMNRGFYVKDKVETIGKRTDILLTSGRAKSQELDLFLQKVSYVIWMSSAKRDSVNYRQLSQIYFYPIDWWDALYQELGHRPSTGCMGIDLFSRIVGTGEVHIYGFDFWRTPSSRWIVRKAGRHSNEIRVAHHNPAAEEAFAMRRIPTGLRH
jgi:hypothetical protein